LGTLAAHGVLTVAVWTASLEGVARLLAVGMLGYTAWLSAVVAHNTVHCPVFRRRWQNSAFQLWVSLSYGFPISEYIPGHNLSHPRLPGAGEEVMRAARVRSRGNGLNALSSPCAVTPATPRGNRRYASLRGTGDWQRQRRLEAVFVWGVK